jgi:TP901-1 family phage major tail protein
MSAQKGSEILIKLGDGAAPEVFTTVAGLRTKSLKLNSEQVDITNSDSVNKWRELLEGAGVKSMSVSGNGVFTDSATENNLLTAKINGTHKNFQVIIPGLGTFEGKFQIADMEYAGEHNKEVTHYFGLESAAAIAFTSM